MYSACILISSIETAVEFKALTHIIFTCSITQRIILSELSFIICKDALSFSILHSIFLDMLCFLFEDHQYSHGNIGLFCLMTFP